MEIWLNTSVLPEILWSRDIQRFFFSVAQSKNDDTCTRDIEELQQ